MPALRICKSGRDAGVGFLKGANIWKKVIDVLNVTAVFLVEGLGSVEPQKQEGQAWVTGLTAGVSRGKSASPPACRKV